MEQMKWIVLSVAVIMYVLVIVFQKKKSGSPQEQPCSS